MRINALILECVSFQLLCVCSNAAISLYCFNCSTRNPLKLRHSQVLNELVSIKDRCQVDCKIRTAVVFTDTYPPLSVPFSKNLPLYVRAPYGTRSHNHKSQLQTPVPVPLRSQALPWRLTPSVLITTLAGQPVIRR